MFAIVAMSLAACGEPRFPSSMPAERTRAETGVSRPVDPVSEMHRRAWLQRRPEPCRLVIDTMREQSGETALDCSADRTMQEALACAKSAFLRSEPFLLCESGWGMDSLLETGVAGLADGNVAFYELDTRGPQVRGTCLRRDVSFAGGDWPACRTALLGPVDLRTNAPVVDRERMAGEEAWPASCADAAARATDRATLRLLSGENPLPEAARWGAECTRATVSFELLIDEKGDVRCARILSAGPGFPFPPLYDAIRPRLLRWRFEPPTVGGTPVQARWGLAMRALRSGEAMSGANYYPVCP